MNQRAFGEQEFLETKNVVAMLLKLSKCASRAEAENQSQ